MKKVFSVALMMIATTTFAQQTKNDTSVVTAPPAINYYYNQAPKTPEPQFRDNQPYVVETQSSLEDRIKVLEETVRLLKAKSQQQELTILLMLLKDELFSPGNNINPYQKQPQQKKYQPEPSFRW